MSHSTRENSSVDIDALRMTEADRQFLMGSTMSSRRTQGDKTSPQKTRNQFLPGLRQEIFTRLAPLPGKALAVYMVLLLRCRLERQTTVSLTTAHLRGHRLTRHEKQDALRHLEAAGLITVDRHLRKNPRVSLREESRSSRENGP